MANETMVYVFIGVIGYFIGYLTVACGAMGIWKMWVWKTAGEFWEYSLNYGLEMYFPRFWQFVKYNNKLYSVLYIILWPVMVPVQLIIDTKTIGKVMSREYWM